MPAGRPAHLSQPLPEDVFGSCEPSPVPSGSSTHAVSVLYSRGDAVWYRQRDGSEVPAKVVAVDLAVYPPSYGVMIGDTIRETEASRLKTRGSIKTRCSDLRQLEDQPNWTGPELQPATSGASFGSFASAAESFAPSHTQEAQVTIPTDVAQSQGGLGQAWPSSPQWQAPQASMAQPLPGTPYRQAQQGSLTQPWPSSPQWQSQQGSTAQPWPTGPQWAQASAHHPLFPATASSSANGDFSRAQLSSSSALALASASVLMQSSTSDFTQVHPNGIQRPLQEQSLSPDAPHGVSTDDDGFGDFAAADHTSYSGAEKPPPPPLQPADRSVPLSLSLFGEDSAASFGEEPPAAMQLGPVWSPAWLATSPPSSPSQAQHAQHAQQESQHSLPAVIPSLASRQQATEDDSDFGSFTGTAAQPTQWLPSSKVVESAQDYITQAEQQAAAHFQTVTSSAASPSGSNAAAVRPQLVRPAAAAATAAVLQSMDRSAPISLGLFGEESYDDPVMELSGHVAQGAAVDQHHEAVLSSPRQRPNAPTERQAGSVGQTWAPEQSPQHDFPPHPDLQPDHELEPSWQHTHIAQLPSHSLSAWPYAADDDFSPSWQQAGETEGSDAAWQNPNSSDSPELVSMAQSAHAFAATWPPPIPDADPPLSQQLPGRQTVSGPISLELFGLEEQPDEPLELPLQPQPDPVSAPPALHPVVTDSHQPLEDGMYAQQPPAVGQAENGGSGEQSVLPRQSSPGSLELFGMEEMEDAPLELPVQATITVLPSDTSTSAGIPLPSDSQEAALQAAAQQPPPGPISLELFGMEDTEDEPLTLPVQATTTALPTPPLNSHADNGMLSSTGVGPSPSASESRYGDWEVQALLMQACGQELQRGGQVLSQAVASNTLEAFQADPNGAAYLTALQHIWRIVLLLQAGADLHGLAQAPQTQHRAAFEEASRQSMHSVVDQGDANHPQLMAQLLSAHQIQEEVSEIAAAASDWAKQHASGHQNPSVQTAPDDYKGLCRLCLIPIELAQLPVTQLQPEVQCLRSHEAVAQASAAALWTNRVGKALPSM